MKTGYRWNFYNKRIGKPSIWTRIAPVIVMGLLFYIAWVLVFAGILWM